MVTMQLFDTINETQDGRPLATFCDAHAEDDIPRVGDCVSMLIASAMLSAADVEELLNDLDYAAREIQRARNAAFRTITAESDATGGEPFSWKAAQARARKGKGKA